MKNMIKGAALVAAIVLLVAATTPNRYVGIHVGDGSGLTNLSTAATTATTATNLAGPTNILGGVPYVLPSSNSVGVLTDDGSGTLSWANNRVWDYVNGIARLADQSLGFFTSTNGSFGNDWIDITGDGNIDAIRGVGYNWPTNNATGSLNNSGSGELTWGGAVTVTATTNQIVFGGTNSAPADTTNAVWISVQVTGDTNTWRLPLYK